jgi:hypothetical protein
VKRGPATPHPALILLFLAPALGELVSGHQAPLEFFNPIVFVALALPYGCGALLCREFARRWGSGWLGVLLLAVAYGLYEEGVVSRALFDPGWRELAALAAFDHAAGINWSYGLGLIHFHVAVSIVASVMLAEMLDPPRRDRPWLSNWQAALCGLGLALWPPVLALLARGDGRPLHVPAPALWALVGVAIVGLTLAARVVPVPPPPPLTRPVPRPFRFLILGAVNMTVVFATVFVLPDHGVAPPTSLSVAFLLAVDGGTLWLILRWSGRAVAWDDRHRLALAAGLLAFFLAFGVLSDLERFEGRSLVSTGAVLALLWLARRIGGRGLGAHEPAAWPMP